MLADGLTKDRMDPADLLRAAFDMGEYQINEEAVILAIKKQHPAMRVKRKETQDTLEHSAEHARAIINKQCHRSLFS